MDEISRLCDSEYPSVSSLKTIVLPESKDIRILNAADKICSNKVANILLIGRREDLLSNMDTKVLESAIFIDPNEFAYINKLAESLYNMGVMGIQSIEKAKDILIVDPLYFGIMLVKE